MEFLAYNVILFKDDVKTVIHFISCYHLIVSDLPNSIAFLGLIVDKSKWKCILL